MTNSFFSTGRAGGCNPSNMRLELEKLREGRKEKKTRKGSDCSKACGREHCQSPSQDQHKANRGRKTLHGITSNGNGNAQKGLGDRRHPQQGGTEWTARRIQGGGGGGWVVRVGGGWGGDGPSHRDSLKNIFS